MHNQRSSARLYSKAWFDFDGGLEGVNVHDIDPKMIMFIVLSTVDRRGRFVFGGGEIGVSPALKGEDGTVLPFAGEGGYAVDPLSKGVAFADAGEGVSVGSSNSVVRGDRSGRSVSP